MAKSIYRDNVRKVDMKKTYSIILLTGVLIWTGAVLLRETSLMDNAIIRRLLWAAPNFGVVWAGVGFTYILYPRFFNKDFDPGHTASLVGVILALLLVAEFIHHFFLDSSFDVWDMAASAIAAVIVLLIYRFRRGKV